MNKKLESEKNEISTEKATYSDAIESQLGKCLVFLSIIDLKASEIQYW